MVPWARAGVGAIATQANGAIEFGPEGLDLLARGLTAGEVLTELLEHAVGPAGRQVAIVDADGTVAAHTGSGCVEFAGHCIGSGVSCQANMAGSAHVWSAMMDAYAATAGPLTARPMAALDAGEGEGGDLRGRQSAAIVVVPPAGEYWRHLVSLRVEDHPDPLAELRRLVRLQRACRLVEDADELVARGRRAEAARLYVRAGSMAPGNSELGLWAGLAAASDDIRVAITGAQTAIAQHPPLLKLLERLPPDAAPCAADVLARIVAAVAGEP